VILWIFRGQLKILSSSSLLSLLLSAHHSLWLVLVSCCPQRSFHQALFPDHQSTSTMTVESHEKETFRVIAERLSVTNPQRITDKLQVGEQVKGYWGNVPPPLAGREALLSRPN
jgi:hypothetical protein